MEAALSIDAPNRRVVPKLDLNLGSGDNVVVSSGQSYQASTIVIYNYRAVLYLKIPHITTPDL